MISTIIAIISASPVPPQAESPTMVRLGIPITRSAPALLPRLSKDGSIVTVSLIQDTAEGRKIVPYRWTKEKGLERLSIKWPQDPYAVLVNALSRDGSTLAGQVRFDKGDPAVAFIAKAGSDPVFVAGKEAESAIESISADGLVAVGEFGASTAKRPFIWSKSEGLRTLGTDDGTALVVSADGTLAYGMIQESGPRLAAAKNNPAVKWTAAGTATPYLMRISSERAAPLQFKPVAVSNSKSVVAGNRFSGGIGPGGLEAQDPILISPEGIQLFSRLKPDTGNRLVVSAEFSDMDDSGSMLVGAYVGGTNSRDLEGRGFLYRVGSGQTLIDATEKYLAAATSPPSSSGKSIKAAGFSLMVPTAWTAIPLFQADLDTLLDDTQKSNPFIKKTLPVIEKLSQSGSGKLFAFGEVDASERAAGVLTATVVQQGEDITLDSLMTAEKRNFADELAAGSEFESSKVPLPAGTFARLYGRMKSSDNQPSPVVLIYKTICGQSVFSFTFYGRANKASKLLEEADSIMRSLRIEQAEPSHIQMINCISGDGKVLLVTLQLKDKSGELAIVKLP